MKKLLTAVVALCAVSLLAGCAGSQADTDFRRKVSAVDIDPTATYDASTGNVTGGAHTHFELRDPDAAR